MPMRLIAVTNLLILILASSAAALEPAEVVVVVNANAAGSQALAGTYCKDRGIPARNLVVLETTTAFDISRGDYQRQILRPLRETLIARKLRKTTRCISLIWGMPVRVLAPPDAADDALADATVDSELALIWIADHPLAKFLPNPHYWKAAPDQRRSAGAVVMTCRIDGPTLADASRLIKNSAAAQAKGLQGRLYVDAGGRLRSYDQRLEALAKRVRQHASLPVVYDDKPTVFPRGACPDAALYVGWHSPGRYIPAFRWVPGAVGWHIGSGEASQLRNPASRQWATQMIRHGVAATLGAVGDPYLGAFPSPEEFFPMLLTGQWTVAECYWRTQPMVSWRMTLIADPLYSPFAANPQIKPDHLPGGLAPPADRSR